MIVLISPLEFKCICCKCGVAVVGVVRNSDASTYSHELTDLGRKLDKLEAEAREEDEAERTEGIAAGDTVDKVAQGNESESAIEDAPELSKGNYAWNIATFTVDFSQRLHACKDALDTSANRIDEIKESSRSPEDIFKRKVSRMPITSTPGIRITSNRNGILGLYKVNA